MLQSALWNYWRWLQKNHRPHRRKTGRDKAMVSIRPTTPIKINRTTREIKTKAIRTRLATRETRTSRMARMIKVMETPRMDRVTRAMSAIQVIRKPATEVLAT